jgi:hypothetical protein
MIEILMNYKSLWQVGYHKDLSKWIALLSRFNNGNPLNKELITKIEDFFEYYWMNNKLAALANEEDIRLMDELPEPVQAEIFVDYLFKEYLYNYRKYFNPRQEKYSHTIFKNSANKTFSGENQNQLMRGFLVEFVKRLEPRLFKNDGDLIQD